MWSVQAVWPMFRDEQENECLLFMSSCCSVNNTGPHGSDEVMEAQTLHFGSTPFFLFCFFLCLYYFGMKSP